MSIPLIPTTTTNIANYVSGLGNNDAVIVGANYKMDVSFNAANTAVSLLSGHIVNSNVYSMAPAVSGNGISLIGWFFPYSTQKSNALLMEIDNSINPIAVYLTGGNTTSLNAIFNGVSVTTDPSHGMVVPNAWNFFCYTVECSGNSAIQSLYLNNGSNPMTNMSASYFSVPLTTTYMGFGPSYTVQFQGKIADMRCLQRVLNPMEITVLSVCNNVGSAGALTIIPSVTIANVSSSGLVTVPYTITNSIAFSTASVFSYLTISRTPAFVSGTSTKTVLGSMLQHVNRNWTWNDVSVNALTSYTYSITPFVNERFSNAITASVVSDYAHGPPTSLLLSSIYNSPNVTLTWTGGIGDNIVLTYTLTSGTANSTTGNLTYNISGGSMNLPVTGLGPWTYSVTATNSKGTTTANTTVAISWLTVTNQVYTINNAIANIPCSSFGGVAVDMAQSRMLFMVSTGIYYATSSNTGASWSGLTLIPNTASPVGSRANGSVTLSQDGTKGLGYGFANVAISIYWPAGTGNVPTATSITFTGGYEWSQVSGKADGSVAVISSYAIGVFYLTWNYTTNVYNSPIQFTYNGAYIYIAHMACCISPDGLTLITEMMPGNTSYFGWITLTWSTTTPPVPTLASNWQPTLQNTSPNGASIIFLGGNATAPPTNALMANVGGPLFMYSWNNVTHTLTSSFQPVTSTWGTWGLSMSAVGPKGNVVYFLSNVAGTAPSCVNISYITLNVT